MKNSLNLPLLDDFIFSKFPFKMEVVLESINSFGHSITSTVSLLLGVNHFVASKLVLVLSLLLSSLRSALQHLTTAVVIILEDLFLFVRETLESAVAVCEFVFALLDSGVESVLAFFLGVRDFFGALFSGVASTFHGACAGAIYSYESTKDFFCLLGQSVLLLLNLVPR